jgi:hypothetical protein
MERIGKIITLFFSLLIISLMLSCSSSRKNPYYDKRKKASHVNTTQVGRNKYFFSSGYQKKLYKGYRKK